MAVASPNHARAKDGFTASTQSVMEHMASSWPASIADGDTALIHADQKEALNRQRGDFPAYERACRFSEEHTQHVLEQCSDGVVEEFPLYASALRARQQLKDHPTYKPYSALSRHLEHNEPYVELVQTQKGAKLIDGTSPEPADAAAATISTAATTPPRRKEVHQDVAPRLAELIGELANEAIAKHGAFSIAIAGGSLVKLLGKMAEMTGVQWDKWHVAWVDERCVPHADKESNYGGASEHWLSKVPIPKGQIHAIDESLTPGGGGMEVASKAAAEYERRLKSLPEEALPILTGGLPAFDLLLLGFGPDGHICSLFPGHPLLQDTSGQWILPIADSPKPPPERITFSLPAVNAASNIIVVGTGDAKAEVVNQVFAPGCQLPIAKAWGRHAEGPLWLLDQEAAKLLQ